MSEPSLLLDTLFPGGSVELGRLVLNIRYPEQGFCSPDIPLAANDTTSLRVENFTHTAQQAKGSSFHATLANIISSNRSRYANTQIDISAVDCVTRQLRDSTQFFKELCESTRVRRWLERALRKHQDVFLVTGIKTVTDATIGAEKTRGKDMEGGVKLPSTVMASAAAGIPIMTDSVLDVSVGLSSLDSVSEKTGFVAPGEHIFAIQYRKIRFGRFSSRRIENGFLEDGNRWKVYMGTRGEEEEDEDDIVDVAVISVVTDEILAEGGYSLCSFGGQDFIFSDDISTAW